MTTTILNIIPGKTVENAQTTQYTVSAPNAASVRAVIDAFAVTNVGTQAAQFSCNLVSNGGAPSNANKIIDEHRVEPGETYLCPELIGQSLENEGSISTLSSVAGALSMRATGRLITT